MQSSANISPLHRQRVKDRQVVITENADLHLVWVDDKIFIKPLPPYLLSYAFWAMFLQPLGNTLPDDYILRQRVVAPAALGFLRTYRYLIRHESDFNIAKKECLIPQNATWVDVCYFTSSLSTIQDADVSGRYVYGEVRLSRLNFYANFPRQVLLSQTLPTVRLFGQLFTPILFVFGLFSVISSVIPSAIQVATGAYSLVSDEESWSKFWYIYRWFSVFSLLLILIISTVLAVLFIYISVGEWCFAFKSRFTKD